MIDTISSAGPWGLIVVVVIAFLRYGRGQFTYCGPDSGVGRTALVDDDR